MALVDLQIISGGSAGIQAPGGYTKIQKDLNAGAGGRYIYLCKRLEDQDQDPICDVLVLSISAPAHGPQPFGGFKAILLKSANPGFGLLAQDLNEGAGGDFTYLGYKRGKPAIQDIDVIVGTSASVQPPAGWEKIDVDLNRNAGGQFVYVVIKR